MKYLTDGTHLYEIAAQRTVKNAGCFWRSGGRHGDSISYIILRDCVSEASVSAAQMDLLVLSPIVTSGSP